MTSIIESMSENLANAFCDGGYLEIRVDPESIMTVESMRIFLSWLRSQLPKDARYHSPIMVAADEDRLCFRFRSVEFTHDAVTRIDVDKFERYGKLALAEIPKPYPKELINGL